MERGLMGQIQSIIHPSQRRPTRKPNYDIIVNRSTHYSRSTDKLPDIDETRNMGKRDDQYTNSLTLTKRETKNFDKRYHTTACSLGTASI